MTLDFVNTLEWRLRDGPSMELLESYEDLLAWSKLTGVLDTQMVGSLRRAAKEAPREADRVYRRAIELREAIYRVIEGMIRGSPPDEKAIRTFNTFVKRTFAGALLGWTKQGYRWMHSRESNNLEAMLDPIVRSTSELLTSAMSNKIAQCHDDRGCGRLFLDRSRSNARRWCLMSECGNLAKAKRHYKRATGRRRTRES